MVLADCQLVYEITATPFEREARIRMRRTEVERFEGVGWGLMGSLRVWKCVEKWGRNARGVIQELRHYHTPADFPIIPSCGKCPTLQVNEQLI
jgi:hypothetical protein